MGPLEEINDRLGQENYRKLARINNPNLHSFIARYVKLCNPDKIYVCTDSPEDVDYIREASIRNGEEIRLAIEGHTAHFDNYYDQARDRKNTGILVPKGMDLGPFIETKDRDWALQEVHEILRDIMKGKELYICFFVLGPTRSIFSIPCVQLTDSAYVAHNEFLLYRSGYEEFVRLGPNARFFKFIHSAGELDERKTSKNLDKRRIYIDILDDTVYSVNTQYGGNSIGLKKLAMRLAIYRGSQEGWLCEHMFILGVHGPGGRVTYFAGAFPSLCGKTSTAMLEGESIVGDDIAFLRKINGQVRAVNTEIGMFGIIQGINSRDDPILWKALNSPGEIIFSNVLVTEEGYVHWIGKDGEIPPRGINHSGEWYIGKRDAEGKEIPCSHPNARFTLSLRLLENLDPAIDNLEGVVIKGIIYGGRDSDTWVPVEEAFDWVHGIITKGAALESERTAAVLGQEGEREFNPMSNLDFLSIPISKYIQINLDFGQDLEKPPRIFSVNYFLKGKDGCFLNAREDKKVWIKWMELRAHDEVEVVKIPTGFIPRYEDLARLFHQILHKNYSREDYIAQFTLRVPENLAKIARITEIYRTKIPDTPSKFFEVMEAQRQRLLEAREKFGDYISPERFSGL